MDTARARSWRPSATEASGVAGHGCRSAWECSVGEEVSGAPAGLLVRGDFKCFFLPPPFAPGAATGAEGEGERPPHQASDTGLLEPRHLPRVCLEVASAVSHSVTLPFVPFRCPPGHLWSFSLVWPHRWCALHL